MIDLSGAIFVAMLITGLFFLIALAPEDGGEK